MELPNLVNPKKLKVDFLILTLGGYWIYQQLHYD